MGATRPAMGLGHVPGRGRTPTRINKFKYTFYAKEVEFLGYIVSLNKIKIDPKKVQAI
jgi:hypothetical protein